ncbi:MAG: hypothetical protein FWD60_04640 [Candidatus Azobacteroides sp.]|nr:hypothetical protein [Candidatus Azobacteroides sp.]
MKTFNGKAIYNPQGKAGEYAKWACNFYVGCSNGCEYCYCKKGILAGTMGGNVPTLKKCFKDETHALEIFEKELKANLPELQKHGLLFSFTTDPMLQETLELTIYAINICALNKIPVKILTKSVKDYVLEDIKINWVDMYTEAITKATDKSDKIAFGFTLTGHDELEPHASPNAERIKAMRKLHDAGFKTWASIEPVIDFDSSLRMILQTKDFCDLFKIGLMSGIKKGTYDNLDSWKYMLKTRIRHLINDIDYYLSNNKIYFKDSLLKQAGISRSDLPSNCVDRDYNLFCDEK